MRSKKIITWLLVLLALIGLAVGGWIYYKKYYLRTSLRDAVEGKSKGLYTIAFGKLDIDEVNGNLLVTQLQLQPDTVRYNELASSADAPSIVAKLKIPSLKVSGVKTPKALLNKEVEARAVLIENPTIELFFTNKGKDSLKRVPDKEVYEQLLGNLSRIAVDTVSIKNATVVTRDITDGKQLMKFDSVDINLFNVAVDSLQSRDSTRFIFSEHASMLCKKAGWSDRKGLYDFTIRDFDFNTRGQRIGIAKFDIQPRLSEAKFLQQFKYAKDRFDISMRDIRLVNMNVAALMNEAIAADSMIVGSGNFRIYRDISYPHDGRNRLRDLPHQQLMRLPLPMAIQYANFRNSYLEYKERNAKSEKSGSVEFHQVNLQVNNLTNDTAILKKQPVCKVQFKSRFLNQAPVNALIRFYPLDANGKFTMEGSLGAMPATAVNALSVPMGLAKIETGHIRGLKFAFTGNDYRTDGPVTILYDDLSVALLKKDEEDKTLDKKKLASFVAGIVIKKANPGKNGEVRTAQVHFERDTHRSFFHLVWKSIFTGVKENVGM